MRPRAETWSRHDARILATEWALEADLALIAYDVWAASADPSWWDDAADDADTETEPLQRS